MKIVIIGAGNISTHLGKALQKADEEIVCVYSRTEESAKALASKLNCTHTTDIACIDNDADIYISALKDSAFIEMAPKIVKGRENALFLHTAGSLSMDVWKNIARRYGVIYPMQTFSKEKELEFGNIPIFIEASSEKDLSLIRELATKLSGKVYHVDSKKRRSLHLAAVFACNFTNHMYTLCDEILEKNGIPFDVMLPLIDETAAKVHTLKPKQAQTGPAIRYDENVINRHMEMLEEDKDMQEIYLRISKSINKLGKR